MNQSQYAPAATAGGGSNNMMNGPVSAVRSPTASVLGCIDKELRNKSIKLRCLYPAYMSKLRNLNHAPVATR